jgi:dTDP-4-amino-4,6-dideoxygalactose transaminase
VDQILFSRPYVTTNEVEYVTRVIGSGHLHGDGVFTRAASMMISERVGGGTTLLTTSCTHALEMASLLADLGPEDEVILPSYTFPSAATAIALRGARIVFADIDIRTGNTSVDHIAPLITPRTKAISIVHYAGVGADIERISEMARDRRITLIEDNAHGLGGAVDERPLGSFGDFATQSFHDTKNIQCGEGGALVINTGSQLERAEIIREKGTNRSRFLRGQVDKYTWVDLGSSYLPSELNAAVLRSQLESYDLIQGRRMAIWDSYSSALEKWAAECDVHLMSVPDGVRHTAHMFFMVMPDHNRQQALLTHLKARNITATFHYGALHESPAGTRYGSAPHGAPFASELSMRIVRLPLWAGMTENMVGRVIESVAAFSSGSASRA